MLLVAPDVEEAERWHDAAATACTTSLLLRITGPPIDPLIRRRQITVVQVGECVCVHVRLVPVHHLPLAPCHVTF